MSNTSKRASPFQSSIFVPRSLKDDNCVIGDIVGEYACVWRTCKGSLFAGSKGVYFLGSFFLFERKLVLGWDQIRQVQKVDRGVEVVLVADDTVHCFSGMPAPDRVWTLLVSLHNDALLDRRGRRRTPRGTLKRRNSDPWNSMVRSRPSYSSKSGSLLQGCRTFLLSVRSTSPVLSPRRPRQFPFRSPL